MACTIHIENCGSRFECSDDSDVLRGMEALGRRAIPTGCRGGGCGICKVRVVAGRYRTGAMSRNCVSFEEQREGYALACKLFPVTDLRLQVVGPLTRACDGAAFTFQRYGTSSPGPATDNERG